MAVAFDAKASTWKSVSSTSLTITTHTVGSGSNRALVLMLLCGSQGVTFPAGLTITRDTGETFTQVSGSSFADSGLTGCGQIWALLNPTSGNKTITVSWTGSNEMHASSVSFTGVDQTSVATSFLHGASNVKTTATASPVSVTITSATGNMTVAAEAQNVSSWGAISGTTIATDSATGPNLAVASSFDNGAATVTMTAAFTGTSAWAGFGCDILAAAGGGGSTLIGPQLRGLIGRLKPQPFKPITLAPPGNPGTPTLVQIVGSTLNDNNGISGNAYQFNMPNVTLAANCLILEIEYPYSATRTVSIADSAGDTWPAPAVVVGTASSGNMNLALYVLPNASNAMHTLTITFDASLKPFRYTLSEWYNVATVSPVDGTVGANSVSGSSANAGSFTPLTQNNANGGHLIYQAAISNDTVGTNAANQASAISATNSAKLLHADNNCTIPSASAYTVQATNGAINPGFAFTQSTPTNFVVGAIALKAVAAGSALPSGIWIKRLLHVSVVNPQTGNNAILFPCDGNLRVATMAAGNNLNQVNSVKDTDNSTGYTDRTSAAGNSQVFESANTTADNANVITLNLNAGEPQFSIHLLDIVGADPSPFMNASGFNGSAPSSGTVFNDFPDHTPNANVAGLTIAQTGMGTAGPQFGFASGAPAGAVFDNVYYTGDTDADRMDNADPFGHFNFSTNTAQTWNWLLGAAGHGSTAFATAVSYKAASAGVTLTAAFGSFTETGEAATFDINVPAAFGSFTETGEAATLGPGIVASFGSFTETGEPVIFDMQMPGAFGSFTFTGEAATFSTTTLLTAAFGSFAETGEAATFDVGMPAAFGSFTLTGEAASFINGTVMSGAFGSFTETGEAAVLDVGVPGAFGAFAFTGEPVTFSTSGSGVLTADVGSFTFTGEPATLTASSGGQTVGGTRGHGRRDSYDRKEIDRLYDEWKHSKNKKIKKAVEEAVEVLAVVATKGLLAQLEPAIELKEAIEALPAKPTMEAIAEIREQTAFLERLMDEEDEDEIMLMVWALN